MNRQTRSTTATLLCLLMLATGCKPSQPFFFGQNAHKNSSSHFSYYKDMATDIEYPDVHVKTLDEVHGAQAPLTLANDENFDVWDITLEEVTRIALANSQVIRELGGRISDGNSNIVNTSPETIKANPGGVTTTYDPGLVESGNGTASGSPLSGTGVEAALSEFDAILDSSITWQYNDRPQNFGLAGPAGDLFAPLFLQDIGVFTTGITKTTADGTTFDVRNNTNYDLNNNGSRIQPSDWFTELEVGFSRPLLQGAGTQYNRISGPQSFQQAVGGLPNQIDGVVISRIRTDITLADFEISVRDFMRDIEDAYWELNFSYRNLEAAKIGRDSALETWRRVNTLKRVGARDGDAANEAQARAQYFRFKAQVETALNTLFRVENRLRYMMGLTPTDKRLIRPVDEPTTALVRFDWCTVHAESLTRLAELRQQKWQVKRREMELIGARNHLLPRLDTTGRYRWVGAGDRLIDSSGDGPPPFDDGSNAWEVLTGGDFQEWELGVQFSMQLGMRRGLTGVRHFQQLLARERAVLQDMELEVSHNLTDAIRDVDLNYQLVQTNFNQRVAAETEVEAVEAGYEVGRNTFDLVLQAQQRRAQAESDYYRSLADYNRAIMRVHHRKGTLLEYNGVYLAEGPWPRKAYFDALRRARQRQASVKLNYKYTRPNVFSRGPHEQITGRANDYSTGTLPDPAAEPITPIEQMESKPQEPVIRLPQATEAEELETKTEITPEDLAVLPLSDTPLNEIQPVNYEQPVDQTKKNVFRDAVEQWQEENAKPLPLQPASPVAQPPATALPLPASNSNGLPYADQFEANRTPVGSAADAAIGYGAGR